MTDLKAYAIKTAFIQSKTLNVPVALVFLPQPQVALKQ